MRERLAEAVEEALRTLVREAGGDPAAIPPVALEVPRQKEHGDFASNAALVLAKRLGRPPRELATRLVELLAARPGLVARAEVAGPGFVNVWLAESRWQSLLGTLLARPAEFGRGDARKGQRVQVEFVSANPTGPLSIGHGRQAVLGDCIARLLEASGARVTREYYFNNGGRQMRVLGASVKARYLELLGRAAPPPEDALKDSALPWPESIDGLPVAFPRDGYQGDYIRDIAGSLLREAADSLVDEPPEGRFRAEAERVIFAEIKATCRALGIEFDVYTNETDLYAEGRIDETLDELRARDLVYEADGALWLRATSLGLERDRVLVKGTGEPTYLLPDIAYHREKFRRGFELVVDVQGADHYGQFPFVRAAAAALGCDPERIQLVMHQFVTLTSGGQTVKQSTRRATFVTVDEVLEQIGPDVFRFFMIQRRPEAHLDFDLDLARETDWTKNPAYYVQYAYARSRGVEREAERRGVAPPDPDALDASHLSLPEELELLRKLAEFPEAVARVADAREPHHVAYYLRELAGLWNPYLQDGKRHRILSDDAGLTAARLALTRAVAAVLANGLALLGMSAPERM
jgi:arginyl-tRNA synthetase